MGKPVGTGNWIGYGFYVINICEQSPVIIQFQLRSPVRNEPIDGFSILTADLYNHVLGYGRLHVLFRTYADPDESGKFHTIARAVFTFPAQ